MERMFERYQDDFKGQAQMLTFVAGFRPKDAHEPCLLADRDKVPVGCLFPNRHLTR